jgi:rod shape-determining protein MreD
VGVATAFALGMGLDLIEGAPLGLSSPGLMLATLILQFNYQRIRQFDPIQQSVVILVLMLLSTGIEQWLRNVTGVPALSAGASVRIIVFHGLLDTPARGPAPLQTLL